MNKKALKTLFYQIIAMVIGIGGLYGLSLVSPGAIKVIGVIIGLINIVLSLAFMFENHKRDRDYIIFILFILSGVFAMAVGTILPVSIAIIYLWFVFTFF